MPNNGSSGAKLNKVAVYILCAALLASFTYSSVTNYRLQAAVETIIELKGEIKVLNIEVVNLKEYNSDIRKSLEKLNEKVDCISSNLSSIIVNQKHEK